MGLKKLLSNVCATIGIGADKAADKLVETNPEAFLDLAIENELKSIEENENKIAEILVHKKSLEKDMADYVTTLKKISIGIRMAGNDGDQEQVVIGTAKYKELEAEYDELKESYDQIDAAHKEATENVIAQRKNVEKMKVEKKSILSRLKAAQTKEDVMKITGSISTSGGSASSFAKAKEVLNKKTNKVNALDETKKSLKSGAASGTKSKYFDF